MDSQQLAKSSHDTGMGKPRKTIAGKALKFANTIGKKRNVEIKCNYLDYG